jgi:hypothetical protein
LQLAGDALYLLIKFSMRISFFASLLAFSALVGCARSPVAPAQPEPVTRIMVIPVAPIAKMYTENKSIPLGVLWQSLADRIKSSDFDKRMEAVRKDMGPKLTAALVRELTAQGYDVQALEGVVRPAESTIRACRRTIPSCTSISTRSACIPLVSRWTTSRAST